MKQLFFLPLILLPLLSFGQTWTVNAGDSIIYCAGDDEVQLNGTINSPIENLSVLWETEVTLGSNTYHAEDFLDSINSLTPTLNNSITSFEPEMTFYLKVTDDIGNEQIDSVTIQISTFYGHLGDYFFHISEGDSVVLQLSAGGGLPPYTYEWLPNSNISDNTVANPVVFPNVSTNYSVTMTDSRGCVIPASTCDVNEVYVHPLSLTELQESEINWYIENDRLIIETEQFSKETIVLYNSCGQTFNTVYKSDDRLMVNLSNLDKGIYFLVIGERSLKFVW